MLYCEFCEISKNTFSYRTPPVAASAYCFLFLKRVNAANLPESESHYFAVPKWHKSTLWEYVRRVDDSD